jgi:hypothetical protein
VSPHHVPAKLADGSAAHLVPGGQWRGDPDVLQIPWHRSAAIAALARGLLLRGGMAGTFRLALVAVAGAGWWWPWGEAAGVVHRSGQRRGSVSCLL